MLYPSRCCKQIIQLNSCIFKPTNTTEIPLVRFIRSVKVLKSRSSEFLWMKKKKKNWKTEKHQQRLFNVLKKFLTIRCFVFFLCNLLHAHCCVYETMQPNTSIASFQVKFNPLLQHTITDLTLVWHISGFRLNEDKVKIAFFGGGGKMIQIKCHVFCKW